MDNMGKKEKCKQIMLKYFGPNSAKQVDLLKEEECLSYCRQKVSAFLGNEKAKVFDNI